MSKRKTNVLLVDDEPALRQLLTAVLERLGYAVRSAHDGFSALTEIRATVPDILLSDLYMPRMSGFELLSVVRRRYPGISVIAMSSAYSGPAVPAGIAADAFYEKATRLHDLLGFIAGMGGHRGGRPMKRAASPTPIWIPRQPDDGEAERIALGCPECMRTFFEIPGEDARVIREVECFYCATPIQYALVQSAHYAPVKAKPVEHIELVAHSLLETLAC
jgi:CheY-like chemotaxis protein